MSKPFGHKRRLTLLDVSREMLESVQQAVSTNLIFSRFQCNALHLCQCLNFPSKSSNIDIKSLLKLNANLISEKLI